MISNNEDERRAYQGHTFDNTIESKITPTAGVESVKKTPTGYTSTLRSILALFLILFPLEFMNLVLHEGGHALSYLALGAKITSITTLYVHPFEFSGYVRPIQFWSNPWSHVAGYTVSILASLLIFILLWRRCSTSNLPLVMLFPFVALTAGIGAIESMMTRTGDFYNILYLTGLPPTLFYALGSILLVIGIFFLASLLPIFGLAPGDWRSLLVVPTALLMWKILSTFVANHFVPGSSIDVQYNLGREILMGVNSSPIFEVIIGVVLALVYILINHWAYRRLPSGLKTEKVNLTWRSLRRPILLCVISVIIGLIFIL
jgi:hypothetical protein